MLRFHANQEFTAMAVRRKESVEPPMPPFALHLEKELNRNAAVADPSPDDRTVAWGGGGFDVLRETLQEPSGVDRWYWNEMAKSQIFVATSGLEPHFMH